MKWLAVILTVLGLTACSTVSTHTPHNGIAEVSTNVYALMDVDFRGIFGSESSLIERNVKYVDDFASARAKVAVPIQARIHGVGGPANWAWFYYKFSLAEVGAPETRKKFSDIVVEPDERWAVDYYDSFNKQKTVRLFEKLVELNDLKNKGILSDVEFEQQKAKLLTDI